MTTGQGAQDARSPQPKARQSPSKQRPAQVAQQSGAAECAAQPEGALPSIIPHTSRACAPSHLNNRAACMQCTSLVRGCCSFPAISGGMHTCCLQRALSWSAGRALASREAAYNHELRRGQRAPDAQAAALAKRAYVRKVPYLVSTAALPRLTGQLERSWGPCFIPLEKGISIGQVSSTGPSIAEQLVERREAGRGAKQGQSTAKAESLLRQQDKAGLPARQLPNVRCHDPRQPSTHHLAAAGGGTACSGPQGQQADSTAAEQRPVQSLAERFADMQRTVMARLTCGACLSSRCAPPVDDA